MKHNLTLYPFKFSKLYFILSEVLQDSAVINKIADTKAAGEVKALEAFYTTLQCEPAKAFYGKRHIERANESQAIETLLDRKSTV